MSKEGTAVITGASSGIGKTFAGFLAKRGYDLILVARRRELLEQIADELGSSCGIHAEALPADLASEEKAAMVAQRIEAIDDLSMLVNNAGYTIVSPFSDSDIERELDMVRVHDLATMRLTRAALPGMISRRQGAIINVSSGAGFTPARDHSIYHASKAFLINFTESLYLELAGSGVRVQVLCPGFTRTSFQSTAGMDISGLPKALWMNADDVVEESLRALERGKVVVIPGKRNVLFYLGYKLLPRPLLYRVMDNMYTQSKLVKKKDYRRSIP